jgi:hypothetical protein
VTDDDAFLELMRSPEFARYRRGEHRLAEGITLVGVHPEFLCEGRGCSVHHPSDHRMRNWPKDFRTATTHPANPRFFDRYCQHRIPHPDPDDIAYWATQGRDIADHNCDGCCLPEGELD